MILKNIKTNQADFNLLSNLIFEKAELTNLYLYKILDIFEQQGLALHCVPLCHFIQFFAN